MAGKPPVEQMFDRHGDRIDRLERAVVDLATSLHGITVVERLRASHPDLAELLDERRTSTGA